MNGSVAKIETKSCRDRGCNYDDDETTKEYNLQLVSHPEKCPNLNFPYFSSLKIIVPTIRNFW